MTNIDMIAALRVGETFTKSQRLPDDATVKEMKKVTAKLASTMRSAAKRAKDRTGLDYHVERSAVITKSDNLIVVVFVTAHKAE